MSSIISSNILQNIPSEYFQIGIHYCGHLLLPGLVAKILFPEIWKKAWLIMLCTMIVDLDHLLTYPDIFVANRCSIGFHPLHSYWAIGCYVLLTFVPKFRIVGVGLLLHMMTDWQDCLWM